jgi:hypothetical protein
MCGTTPYNQFFFTENNAVDQQQQQKNQTKLHDHYWTSKPLYPRVYLPVH